MVGLSLCLFSFDSLEAGVVRTVYTDNVTIQPINLKMGQSTILRFLEKPKKVVLGNANYYSVEFIENDLAIQPLGEVTTNLFVYGMKNVYGFILRTNQSSIYDDLVQVDLKENKASLLSSRDTLKVSPFKEVSNPRILFQVGSELKVMISKIQKLDGKDFYIIDFQIENLSKEKLDLSKIEFSLFRGKFKLSPQEFILSEVCLSSRKILNARMFVLINKKSDVDLQIIFKKISVKQIILGRFL